MRKLLLPNSQALTQFIAKPLLSHGYPFNSLVQCFLNLSAQGPIKDSLL